MSALTLTMASPKSLKRSYDDAGLQEPTHISNDPTLEASASRILIASGHKPNPHPAAVQYAEVNGSTKAIVLPDVVNDHTCAPTNGLDSKPPSTGNQVMAKRTKLTFEEKELQRIEKDFKAREKAEEKAKKEEERAKKGEEKKIRDAVKQEEKEKKEEERKVKDAAREEKRKAKEQQAHLKKEEKRAKEEGKKRQEDEKDRKTRNQLRLNAFFSMPSIPNNSSSTGSPTHDAHSPLSSRRSSIGEIHLMEASRTSRSVSITPRKAQLSGFEREFKPFYLPKGSVLAPHNHFSRDREGLDYVRSNIDSHLSGQVEAKLLRQEQARPSLIESLQMPPNKVKRRSPQVYSVKQIMQEIEGTTSHPIDLTGPQFKKVAKNPLDLLAKIPMKVLQFREDVRPPYVGTYTRIPGAKSVSHLARNPFSRDLPKVNYDYDSEAEWEEPIDGEDLFSEGEEEDDEDEDGDEMAAFLDDEGSTDVARTLKRRPVLGDQKPVCTGLCWDGPAMCGISQKLADPDWRLLKMDILMGEPLEGNLVRQMADLIENPQLPIDPYCSTYWQSTMNSTSLHTAPNMQGGLMEPPRFPLQPTNRQNSVLPLSAPSKTAEYSISNPQMSMKPGRAQRHIAPELMDEFKAFVQDNDLTKIGLLEILKKKFPKQSKDAIKDTLEMVAERVGPKVSERKWKLKEGI